MPNHVRNRLEIIGSKDQVEQLFRAFNTHHEAKPHKSFNGKIIYLHKNGSVGWLDEQTNEFSRRNEPTVVGVPDGYEIDIESAFDHFPDFEKVIPQPKNIFNGDLSSEKEDECRKQGIPTWYDWNQANWGTKWNCYNVKSENETTFFFDTAWSSVPVIIETISLQFPDVEIIYEYADEDTGYNCGRLKFKNGLIEEDVKTGGTKDAYELAFKLRPDYKQNYKLVDDNYIYFEE